MPRAILAALALALVALPAAAVEPQPVSVRAAGCRAVVALSPSGEIPARDLDFRDRAAFLVGTRGDDVHSALAVRRMAADVQGDVTIRLVAGNEPGIATALEPDDQGPDADDEGGLVGEVVRWLDRHL